MRAAVLAVLPILAVGCATGARPGPAAGPVIVVLGVGQDGGVPQAGAFAEPGWDDPSRARLVSCLGLVDPRTGVRFMLDATPDFRRQLTDLDRAARALGVSPGNAPLDGVFLTHAHIGHYTGLMFLGHESMGARGVPVYAMPRMQEFLRTNGPWDQLVRYRNVELRPLSDGAPVELGPDLRVTPLLVPHRQEYSEVVGFRVDGPARSLLFIPDIDSWEEWDAQGTRLEVVLATVDVAYLDGTFFANGELGGRDMTGFPHPFVTHTIERLGGLDAEQRAKVRFIHLNHTNPALDRGSAARGAIEAAGMRVAEEGERVTL